MCWQSGALWTLTREAEPYRNQSVTAPGGQTKAQNIYPFIPTREQGAPGFPPKLLFATVSKCRWRVRQSDWEYRKMLSDSSKKEKKVCMSLTCCSSQRSESAQPAPVPIIFIGPFSRLLLPAWNHVCAVWSGPELEDNQPKRSCGNPTLIKRTGAVVLCRAGYLPACLQEDLTFSPPMEAPLCYTDRYLHFSEPEQAS